MIADGVTHRLDPLTRDIDGDFLPIGQEREFAHVEDLFLFGPVLTFYREYLKFAHSKPEVSQPNFTIVH